MFAYPKQIELVEIGPRDGFQSVKDYFIPTETKKRVIDMLVEAGCKKIQATSFVNPKAIPQMKDAAEVGSYALQKYPGVTFFALTPNGRGVINAVEAGFNMVSFVISVTEGHNMSNVRCTVDESFAKLKDIRRDFPELRITLDASTAFGCPFDGKVTTQQVVEYLKKASDLGIDEVDLCDTIGIANPAQVEEVVETVMDRFPHISFGIHIHDTRNMGVVNSLIAVRAGINRVSSTVGGMGGCPFAPGASGNTSSEDLVYMFNSMNIETGIDFEKIMATAKFCKDNIPANYSGHQMNVSSRQCVMG